jgi:hypothetical protein
MAVALVGLLVVPSVALGKNAAGRERQARPMRARTLDQSQLMDVNRISMIVTNFGSFAFDAGAGSAGLEFPKGTGQTAVFAGGLWLGGKINGVTKVAVTGYSNEWFPGPIQPGGPPADPDAPEHRVYKLNRVYANDAERDAALADYNAGAVPDGADPVTVQGDGTLDILGDQMTWCVYNEADSSKHADSGEDAGHTGPMGVEVQQTIFGFSRQGALGQTVFLRFRLINQGTNQIDSMFVSVWSDPDLGNFTDDLVGCDVPLSVGFVYNATNNDAIYGSAPPCVGYDFFKGPTGYGGSELGLTSFNKYSNEQGGDPDLFTQVYNFQRGLNRDGTPVINPVTGQVTTYVVSGDPVSASGWLDNSPADRRLMLSSGPFFMAPGDTQEVVAGLVIGDGDNRLASVSLMKFYDSFAQSAFDQNFDLAPPPNPPLVDATPSEGSAILTWTNASESYSDAVYGFEGYVVYQGQARSGPWKRLTTFDIPNGITVLKDLDFDAESGQILEKVKALGADQGLAYRYEATTDAWRGGPLIVGTPYYYAVTAYSVGIGQTPQVLESAIIFDPDPNVSTVYTVIPQTPVAGTVPGGLAGPTQGQEVPGAAPPGTDDVTVTVVDPNRLVTASYKLGYKPDATGVLMWYIVRTTSASTDTVVNNQSNFSGDNVYPVFDGLQLKISGAPLGNLLRVTYTNVGPNPQAYVGYGSDLGMPFFDGSADYAINTGAILAGLGSALDPTVSVAGFRAAEIRFTGGPAGQKAYVYHQSATAPRTYPYVDYVDVPFTVWDIEGNRQLNCGIFEWDATVPPPDLVWNPDFLPDPFAKREWMYIFASDYSGATPDPFYTTTYPNARYDSANLDFMYVWWCAQAQDGGGAPIPADAGDVVTFTRSSRSTNDFFSFSTQAADRNNVAAAQSEFSRIRAVPNPYFAHSRYEFNQFNRVVKFTHLPARCTIRIFNLAGDLVRTLQKDDANSSQTEWDLLTTASLPVASGIYIFHVDAPGFGTHVGKVAIFMEKERLNTF